MSQQMNSLDAVKRILSGGNMPGEKTRGDQRRYKLPNSTDEVRLRVLPQKDDPSFPMKISIYHYDIPGISKGGNRGKETQKPKDGGKERGASVKCLQMWGLDCPICRVLKKYDGRLELENWAAKVSGIANVLVKDDPTQRVDSRLPHLVYFSMGIIKWFQKMFESEDGLALVNVNSGYDIIINRKKYNGAFDVRNGLTASPLADSKDKIKDIMAQAYNLNEIVGKPDDNLITRSREAAKFLEAEIEGKILSAADGVTGEVPSFDPDEQIPDFKDSESEEGETEEETTETETEEQEETAEETEETTEQEAEPTAETPPKTKTKASSSAATTKGATKAAAKPAAQGKAKEKVAAKPKAKIAKPAGAPDCFGNEDEHDPGADKCLECPHEFYCENAIATAKGK